jgi:hypothetical protein
MSKLLVSLLVVSFPLISAEKEGYEAEREARREAKKTAKEAKIAEILNVPFDDTVNIYQSFINKGFDDTEAATLARQIRKEHLLHRRKLKEEAEKDTQKQPAEE